MIYLKTERKFNMTKKQNMILEDYKESLDILRINSKGLLLNNNFKDSDSVMEMHYDAVDALYKYYDVLTIMKTKKPVLSLISKNIGLDKYNSEANKLGSVSLNEQEYNMLLDFLNK